MTDVFLSHSWEDKPFAYRIEADLGGRGVAVWVDHSELRGGQVLIDELQDAILDARSLGLLWTANAAGSRWVTTEWQAAFVVEKTIIPCVLDDTDLPLFLRTLLFCDFRASYVDGLAGLLDALRGRDMAVADEPLCDAAPAPMAAPAPRAAPAPEMAAPRSGGPAQVLTRGVRWLAGKFFSGFGGLPPVADAMLSIPNLSRRILDGQTLVLDALGRSDPKAAAKPQKRAGALVDKALRHASEDAQLLNLAGYQKKNAYLIRHWSDVQRGTYPPDRLLEEAEDFFHESLSAKPDNPSAWNGLGSVFLLRGDLDAAEFFVKKALERGKAEGVTYGAAKQDLELIGQLKGRGGSG